MESERDRKLKALSLLDEPVRRRLFDWVLEQNRAVGREEASRALRISRPLATFHLDKLADAGLLDSGYQRLSGRTGPGAGRPARVYWRTEREFNVHVPERNYERAAELFATALEAHTGGLPTPLREAAGDLGKNLGQQERARSSTRRLMEALKAGGYEPQVDESGAIRLAELPVPRAGGGASAARLRHEHGAGGGDHSRRRRDRHGAGARLPARLLLRQLPAISLGMTP